MNSRVDEYLLSGCGRCKYYDTPSCKVHRWRETMLILRSILLDFDLTEEIKWSMPCYTFQGKNILILSAFKEYCSLNFFKGSLLNDPDGILTTPTENSQASRQLRFTSPDDVIKLDKGIRSIIAEAIEIEKSGKKVEFKETAKFHIPEEFQQKLTDLPELKKAFEALTPGRQRAYLLFFTQPKQSKTRESRIEKWIPQIMKSKGFND